MEAPLKTMMIFIDGTDTMGESRLPLHDAIVESILRTGSGATMHGVIAGSGSSRQLPRKRLFCVTGDRRITRIVTPSPAQLRRALPAVVDHQLLHPRINGNGQG